MEPKSFSAGFVTARDRRIGRQPEPRLRADDFLKHPIGRGGNLPHPRPLPQASREPEFPAAFTQFERQ
jgi:hypothetical protein